MREGPAADTLAALPGPFDLVFLDADRASDRTYLELAVPRLAPGGLLVADNVVSHRAEIEDFLARVKGHPGLLSVTVPVRPWPRGPIGPKRARGAGGDRRRPA